MKNSKLTTILKTLNEDEFKKLGKFIDSPYFMSSRNCAPLYNILKKYYPGFNESDIEKKKIYEELFPGKNYGDAKSVSLLSTLSSDLYKLCREFLVQIELEEQNPVHENLLLNQLRKRNLFKEFTKQYDEAKHRRNENHIGAVDLYHDYMLENIMSDQNHSTGDITSLLESSTNASEAGLAFGLISGYKYMAMKGICEVSYNIKPRYNFTETMLNYLDNEKFVADLKEHSHPYYPYVYANYLVYMLTLEPDSRAIYNSLKETVENNFEHYGRTEKFILYSVLVSTLIGWDNKHHEPGLVKEMFEIFKKMLEFNIYKIREKEDFEVSNYRNMLMTAFELRELDWAEEFIQKTSGELPVMMRESMMNYSYANLYFLKKDYEKALSYIIKVQYDFPLHKIDAKILTFRIYYELGEYEHAYSVLDTTARYLSNTKELAKVFVERNSNFIKFAGELIKMRTSGKIKDKEHFISRIESEKAVELRGWLIRKINELK